MEGVNQKIKYFLYARKSSESEDRQVASIESQIEVLTEMAKKEGLEIVEVISEAKSAKAPGRPEFNKMIERIYKGEAQGIICWKLDRLARNPIDGGQIMWMLQQGIIRHIKTYERSYYPTDNVLIMSVELGMANQFIRDLSQNTKRGLRAKAERGWYPGHAPVGYTHNPLKRKGEKEIIKDPERFDLVRKMFDLMLTGAYTPPQILKIATHQWGFRMPNGKPMARNTIYRIFTNPFYYGMFEYPKGSGNWYKGAHEPMITEEEYNRIQKLIHRKGNTSPKSKVFAFRGLIRCGECGALITAEEKIKMQKNGNVHRYVYYHCTKRKNPNCSQKCIEEKELEKQIVEILERITIPPEFHQWALKWLKEENKKEMEDRNRILRQNPEVILDNFSDLEVLITLAKKRFKEKGESVDWDDPRRVETFKNVIKFSGKSYKVRMIKVKINGKDAGVDLVCVFNKTYYAAKCGYNISEFSGIGNFINLYEIDDAIKLGMEKIDFLQNNYQWKNKYFPPVPLYKFEKK